MIMSFRILERANLRELAPFFPLSLAFIFWPGFEACSRAAEAASVSMPPAASRTVDFVKDVQPILSERCYSCHGPDKQKGELRHQGERIQNRRSRSDHRSRE